MTSYIISIVYACVINFNLNYERRMDGDVVRVVNELLRKAGRSIRLSRAEQCDCDLVYSLYEVLFGGHVIPRPSGELIHSNYGNKTV